MATNRIAALCLALIAAGCAIQPMGSRLGPEPEATVASRAVTGVDPARLRATMAHLTGHEALPDGTIIPERGSAGMLSTTS